MPFLKRAFLLTAICAVLCVVPRAQADLRPALPPEDQKPIKQWFAAIGIFVVCGAILFKNSKRSHQD
ncbi:MAG: hypothetical protein GXP29_02475 [Planctomycetes bacterium]|nr:hypothetical protein [Planctomycetota bacterium]